MVVKGNLIKKYLKVVKDGVLMKYKGKSKEVTIPNTVTDIESNM